VAQTGSGIDLATSLSTIASWRLEHDISWPVPAMVKGDRPLSRRVRHVLGDRAGTLRQSVGLRGWPVAVAAGLFAIAATPAFVPTIADAAPELPHLDVAVDPVETSRTIDAAY